MQYTRSSISLSNRQRSFTHTDSPRLTHQHGFTLIEILVALMIFAVIGMVAAMSLHSVIRARERLRVADRELLRLEMTMAYMRQDFSEIVDRKIRNHDGQPAAAFLSEGSGVAFTRASLLNPFGDARQANLQRVAYHLQGEKLERLTWDVLDQAPDSKPEVKVLLTDVDSLTWQFVTENGRTANSWPPPMGSVMQQESHSDTPKVVLLVMKLKGSGTIQGVFPVAAGGKYATLTQ